MSSELRVLALDIGERRIGVAVSDPSGKVATPVKVLDSSVLNDTRPLRRLIEDYEVDRLVVGLPLTLAGEEGPQAQRVRDAGDRLASTLGVPVEYRDERLSSAEARRAMAAGGADARSARGSVDMVAAALVLQGWLDERGSDRDG